MKQVPETAQEYEDIYRKCWCCEGTGKAFNAINCECDECLYCGGSGKPKDERDKDRAKP